MAVPLFYKKTSGKKVLFLPTISLHQCFVGKVCVDINIDNVGINILLHVSSSSIFLDKIMVLNRLSQFLH